MCGNLPNDQTGYPKGYPIDLTTPDWPKGWKVRRINRNHVEVRGPKPKKGEHQYSCSYNLRHPDQRHFKDGISFEFFVNEVRKDFANAKNWYHHICGLLGISSFGVASGGNYALPGSPIVRLEPATGSRKTR